MKIQYLLAGIIYLSVSLSISGLSVAQAAEVDTDVILQRLQTNCYNENKVQFDDAKSSLPPLAVEQIDLQSLGQDEQAASILESLGITAEDLVGYQAMFDESQQYSINAAKDAYRQLADINIHVAECYERELVNEPTMLPQAQAMLSAAKINRQAIEDYDFSASVQQDVDSQYTLTIPAGDTRSVRLRTFCIDGGLNIPSSGEAYYLAGDASQLQDSSVCDVVTAARSNDDMTTTQNTIWTSLNTELKPSSEIEPIVAPTITPSLNPQITNTTTTTAAPVPIEPLPLALTIGGGVALLVLLIGGGLKWSALTTPVSKTALIVGLVLAAGVTVLGVWQLSATTIEPTSLYEAQQRGLVVVEATAPGTYTALDVTIHNYSPETLDLDTRCLTFIPKVGPKSGNVTTNTNSDTTTTDNNGDVDSNGEEESGDEGSSDDGSDSEHGSQRLMSNDIIDDIPPLPPEPPEPEDTFDLDKLRKKIEQRVRDAKDKYTKDPSEENLKDLLKETAKCMALGCSEENTLDDVADTWQKNVDQATKDYQENPTPENYDALKRATEIGQFLGSNTDAAVGALVGEGS